MLKDTNQRETEREMNPNEGKQRKWGWREPPQAEAKKGQDRRDTDVSIWKGSTPEKELTRKHLP